MFSQLLIVRLKAAEHALRDGRLDEAYRMATASDIREHRRGGAVLAKLTKEFLKRARAHFRAERFTEAVADLNKAETSGTMTSELAELRKQVEVVAAECHRQDQSRRNQLEAAKRRIEAGSLAGGRKMLEDLDTRDHSAGELRRDADRLADDARDYVKQAEKLIAQGQYADAAHRIARARAIAKADETVAHIESKLCREVVDQARKAIVAGRLGRAGDELACLGGLGDDMPTKRELLDILGLARQATECLRAHQYADARIHAKSLDRLLPKTAWIKAAIDQLKRIEELTAELGGGPLGSTLNEAAPMPDTPRPAAAPRGSLDETMVLPARSAPEGLTDDKLLLLVDGGGSFLLIRQPQVSIGRAASTQMADVPIFSDLGERHANISRVDDDYFLFSSKTVEVGGQKTKNQLLRDGDRLVLGKKAKFSFRLPSRRSSTAVLDLSDTTKMPNDVRRVVLFNEHATIGQGATAHIHCRHVSGPMILFERRGSLWIRQKNDGHVDVTPVELRIGEPIEIGGMTLTLQRWQVRHPGSGTA